MIDDDVWRDSIQPCTFSEAIKVLRVRYYAPYAGAGDSSCVYIYGLHIYGVKAAGEVPDDILFLDDDASGDPEFIRDLDFGDRPEGTTMTHRIKLFNSSTTKIANNLTLSLIDTDFTFSMDEGATWLLALPSLRWRRKVQAAVLLLRTRYRRQLRCSTKERQA
jgi:hypothetical protein